MDIYESKNIKPMLIGLQGDAFDSPDFVYELKLDGVRCLAYLDNTGTDLRNKMDIKLLPKYPELANIHKQSNARCILDGELVVMHNGKPNFDEIMRRATMTNKMKIEMAASQLPVCFTAFDILYFDNMQITDLPLTERKDYLQKAINENSYISISRFIEQHGKAFYKLVEQNDLEGIVAKRKDSRYYLGKRTKDWIKIKNLLYDDYVVCGYMREKNGMTSLILAQYRDEILVYKGM